MCDNILLIASFPMYKNSYTLHLNIRIITILLSFPVAMKLY